MLAVGCAAVLSLFFYEIIFLGRTFVPTVAKGVMGDRGVYQSQMPFLPDYYRVDLGASAWALEPFTHVVARQYREGHVPIWNGHQGFGSPLLGNAQAGSLDLLRLPAMLGMESLFWDLYTISRAAWGLIAAYLFGRAVGLVRPASAFLAIAYVFSGHFLIYSNNTWISGYYLLPVTLLGTEWLATGRLRRGFAVIAVAAAMNILVGMPEVTLFVFLGGGGYAVARLLETGWREGFDRSWYLRVGIGITAWLTGIGLAAPLLLPLFEFAGLSVNRVAERTAFGMHHEPWTNFFIWFAPYLKGRMIDPDGRNALGTYVGMTVLYLAIYGSVPFRSPLYWRIAPASLVIAALSMAKVFGMPIINDVGRLPVLNVILIHKWLGPVTALALVMLASLGVHRLIGSDQSPRAIRIAPIISTLLISLAVIANIEYMRNVTSIFTVISLITAAISIAFVWFITYNRQKISSIGTGIICIMLLVIELFVYAPHGNYQFRADRFNDPPFVDYLTRKMSISDQFRVFSNDDILYPNSSSVYGLDDIRSLDALYIDRYLIYIQKFISPGVFDRYTGAPSGVDEGKTLTLGNRWFDLTGVRYIVTHPDSQPSLDLRGGLFTEETLPGLWVDCASQAVRCARLETLSIDRQRRAALIQAVPATVTRSVMITPAARLLRFSVALDPRSVAAQTQDGVEVVVAAVIDGRRESLFQRRIEPAQRPGDRRWLDGEVDLTRFQSKTLDLVFETRSLTGTSGARVAWAVARLEAPPDSAAAQYRLVYDAEVQIFENQSAMPRAFLVGQIVPADSITAAVSAMQGDRLDPAVTAVVEGVTPEHVSALTGATGQVAIQRRTPTAMALTVDAAGPTWLVLTDSYYPGWIARLDGQEVPIYATNVAFRGIAVPAGRHQVEFVYQPTSLRNGLLIMSAALVAFVIVIVGITVVQRGSWGRARRTRSAT